MVTNFTFKNKLMFVRDRYSRRFSMLVDVANELGEDVNVAERHISKSGEFVISIQVGDRTQLTQDFRRLSEILEEMGGELTPITLIATEDFRGLIDK